MNETRTTQPFGPFFPLIFTVAKWICRLLHPVTVQPRMYSFSFCFRLA